MKYIDLNIPANPIPVTITPPIPNKGNNNNTMTPPAGAAPPKNWGRTIKQSINNKRSPTIREAKAISSNHITALNDDGFQYF